MKKLIVFLSLLGFLVSCTTISRIMREPQTRLELEREDLELSPQVTAEATTTKILGVDWARLFISKEASTEKDGFIPFSIVNIPVIGNVLLDKTANYALYELMEKNPGYDIVLYPQYEIKNLKPVGIPIVVITTAKVTARLAKIK
ncbi:MAG: hypothetical protein N2Z72_05480 [Bacteroidales bacterium]|nr:hypothetical protein [Bacteroidales bacterium]